MNKESVTYFSQFSSEKAQKNLRKSQAQFQDNLRKLRLTQNDVSFDKTFNVLSYK